MGTLEVEGLNVVGLIESGGCGSVYAAENGPDNLVALKLFDVAAINPELVSKATRRLGAGGWPKGVMPVLFDDFQGQPATRIMPLLVDENADGERVPRSLQNRMGEFPNKQSWPLIRSIAHALAEMHAKRVAHANLKPGNVFFNREDEILLTDWVVGNVPGAGHFEFTDALLYQPPEQLREPAGYLDEAGYRWDVFAFGVLAFRLLTGEFPRCNETFLKVAPEPGKNRRDGINADTAKIARNLESKRGVNWPAEPESERISGFREWIDACLNLDPTKRPATMGEVVAGFEVVDLKIASEAERKSLLEQKRRASHRAWRWFFMTGIVTLIAMFLGVLWQLSLKQLTDEKQRRVEESTELKLFGGQAKTLENEAIKEAEESKLALDYERDLANARLEASRMIGDRLFGWAMEKGNRRLPPLDGRSERLKTLDRYFEDFLSRTAAVPSLEKERARIRLQLAEISLAAGEPDLAIQRLGDALDAWKSEPMESDLKLRMATNRLLLALLLQSNNDPRMESAFVDAREELGAIPASEVDAARLQQLVSILDFHEAKMLSARGDNSKALEQLMTATQTLNRLAGERPDSVVLRSELAACYLSSATILEGMGNLGDAREVQSLAAAEIVKMLKENPKDPGLRFDLAGCYGSMAEAAVLSGDIVNAETLSLEALKLLEGIVREQPDHAEAIARMAAQIGLRAGLMRDRGESAAALKSFDDGIRLLEGVQASAKDNALVSYRLALLWWQKGRMLGMAGKRAEEIELIRRAQDALVKLEAAKNPGGPPMDKIQSSSAYLLGDLGHALQLAGKRDEAKTAFSDSIDYWDLLLKANPKSEEYLESLAWCRQRVKELE